jgi:hypothetical protein
MNLLPVRLVPLVSDLPPAALLEGLRGVVGVGAATPFAGAVSAEGFAITRLNEFGSTIMPLLRGRVSVGPGGGARVLVRLRPSGTVFAFMGIWLAFLASVAAIILLAHARDASRSLAVLLVPAGLGVFTWYLMAAVFDADARWAVEHLLATFPALRPGGAPANTEPVPPRTHL